MPDQRGRDGWRGGACVAEPKRTCHFYGATWMSYCLSGERPAPVTRDWLSASSSSQLWRRRPPMVVGGWFIVSLRSGFPDLAAIQKIGEMDQATSVFDDQDRLAFTIYKEQRIEVPLSQMSPHLVQRDDRDRGSAVLRASAASTSSASGRRRSPISGAAAPRRAPAPSPSSSRVRASSRPTRHCAGRSRS